MHGHPFSLEWWSFWVLCAPGDKRVISVVCTVVGMDKEDANEFLTPGDDQLELVPVMGPWVSPGLLMDLLTLEAVGHREALGVAQFWQPLAIFSWGHAKRRNDYCCGSEYASLSFSQT